MVASVAVHVRLGDCGPRDRRQGGGHRRERNSRQDGRSRRCRCAVRCLHALPGVQARGTEPLLLERGYADRVRCQADFVFQIPEAISSAEAAPLMCAGVTTYAPLARFVTRPSMKVGIIGVGGLGHLGVMWASKMQAGSCEVVAISHNARKRDEALAMGAKAFLDTSDPVAVKQAARSFDLLLCTANGKGQDYNNWLALLKLSVIQRNHCRNSCGIALGGARLRYVADSCFVRVCVDVFSGGVFCMVGAPEVPMELSAFSLLQGRPHVTGSAIGSIDEVKEMLQFAVTHNIRPIIECLPMDKVNDGIKKMRDGNVRFRVVLENC